MKLEDVLSKELFEQVKAAIDAVNEKEPDKLKHVRFTDLSEGEYVSKEKYSTLETDKGSIAEQLRNAQELIEELKKGTKSDETLNGKITEYETKVAALTAENEKLKVDGALKVALLDAGAKASDIDYLMFKAASGEKEVRLDDAGNLKGCKELMESLKTQFPSNFAAPDKREYQEHRLETGEDGTAGGEMQPKNLAEALKMQYENSN